MPRDVRGVPGPRAGAGGGGALQGERAERGDQAAEYWGPAQIPRSVLDMHSRYLIQYPHSLFGWNLYISSTYSEYPCVCVLGLGIYFISYLLILSS